eukprot:1157263-Pelagomonas_calceolata.AAC.6
MPEMKQLLDRQQFEVVIKHRAELTMKQLLDRQQFEVVVMQVGALTVSFDAWDGAFRGLIKCMRWSIQWPPSALQKNH